MYKVRATYLPRTGMEFDLEHYHRVHVPLARTQTAGRVKIRKIELETDASLLMEPAQRGAPCVFCMYFDTAEDVEQFRHFMRSADVEPLRADVAHYTNCELEWTVSRVQELAP